MANDFPSPEELNIISEGSKKVLKLTDRVDECIKKCKERAILMSKNGINEASILIYYSDCNTTNKVSKFLVQKGYKVKTSQLSNNILLRFSW